MLVLLALVSVSRIQIAAPVLKGDQWTGNDRKRADMSVCAFKAIDHIRSDRIITITESKLCNIMFHILIENGDIPFRSQSINF